MYPWFNLTTNTHEFVPLKRHEFVIVSALIVASGPSSGEWCGARGETTRRPPAQLRSAVRRPSLRHGPG